jgi:hypothetical protein
MRLGPRLASFGIAALVAVQAPAQTCVAQMQPDFRNLDFGEGNAGERPPGWEPSNTACLAPPHDPDLVETVSGASCYSGRHCAVVRSVLPAADGDEVIRYISLLRAPRSSQRWGLFQVVDVARYLGKVLTFRAAVRAKVPSGSEVRLFVRIHRANGSTSFFDDMGQFPVRSSAWYIYDIPAPIGRDAHDVEFGMTLIGQGEAWLDHVSVDFSGGEK